MMRRVYQNGGRVTLGCAAPVRNGLEVRFRSAVPATAASVTAATKSPGMATTQTACVATAKTTGASNVTAAKVSTATATIATAVEMMTAVIAAMIAATNQNGVAIIRAVTTIVGTIISAITCVPHAYTDIRAADVTTGTASQSQRGCGQTGEQSQSSKSFHMIRKKVEVLAIECGSQPVFQTAASRR